MREENWFSVFMKEVVEHRRMGSGYHMVHLRARCGHNVMGGAECTAGSKCIHHHHYLHHTGLQQKQGNISSLS